MASSYGESREIGMLRDFVGAVHDREKLKSIQMRLPCLLNRDMQKKLKILTQVKGI
jgi:hypothetical protein